LRYMPLLTRRKRQFDVPVEDMVLRVTGPEDVYEEARAAGMQFWEQVQAYGINNPAFRTSRRPLALSDDAPAFAVRMAAIAGSAGVGPVFTLQGALIETVGQVVAASTGEAVVSSDGDYFVAARRRSRLPVHAGDGRQGALAVVLKPELGSQGIHTTAGRTHMAGPWSDSLVIVARSCMLADAVAAGASIVLSRSRSMRKALGYIKGVPGVHGGIVLRGNRIGVAGSLELAA
jgi:uncharacterized protein